MMFARWIRTGTCCAMLLVCGCGKRTPVIQEPTDNDRASSLAAYRDLRIAHLPGITYVRATQAIVINHANDLRIVRQDVQFPQPFPPSGMTLTWGYAVAIAEDGYWLTAHHVCDDHPVVGICGPDGAYHWYRPTVLTDPRLTAVDNALLHVPVRLAAWCLLASGTELGVGIPVVAGGGPGGLVPGLPGDESLHPWSGDGVPIAEATILSAGAVLACSDAADGLHLEASAPVHTGCSGSGLYLLNGQLAGIVIGANFRFDERLVGHFTSTTVSRAPEEAIRRLLRFDHRSAGIVQPP